MSKRCAYFALLMVSMAMIQDGALYGAWNPLQDPALLGWWTCDEGTGGVVADSSPHGNDGTFINGSPAWTTGVYGNAVRLAGPTLVEVPALGITLTEATMAGWFLPDGVQPDWASIIMHRNLGLAHGFNLLADHRLAYHWNDTYASWSFRGSAYYAAEEWTFCAVTVQPTRATFYVNGSAASINTIAHAPATWDGPLWLGGDGDSSWVSRRMNGALDDVSFFSRVLTEAEIQTIMLGLGAPGPSAGARPSTEDFETNDFRRYPWTQDGDLGWQIALQERHRGLCSAASGPIADGESSVLRVILTCVSGEITFYRKVSSEANCDNLAFFIDGVEQDQWSGEQDWAEVAFPVSRGTRVFEWVYTKDGSFSKGADTAWIDDIVFPAPGLSLPNAGPIIVGVVRANGEWDNRAPMGPYDGATSVLPTQVGGLKDGNLCFSDRTYPWAWTPAQLAGAESVRTFNSDKKSWTVTYTVTTSREATVMITVDDRIFDRQRTANMASARFAAAGRFADTGLNLYIHEDAVTDRPQSVFSARLPAGTYVFGPMTSENNFYIIAAMD
jgi:hypothetical protein